VLADKSIDNRWYVFNAYGVALVIAARVLAQATGLTYEACHLVNGDHGDDGLLWINEGKGFVLSELGGLGGDCYDLGIDTGLDWCGDCGEDREDCQHAPCSSCGEEDCSYCGTCDNPSCECSCCGHCGTNNWCNGCDRCDGCGRERGE
jgi:hypothetical protein